ncbi:MAG: hypothetical protein AVDCRST_MAG71-1714 [uncultured Lysobacter sp.]|uniref:Uncharacterized protein n=1 Tax=uncultured Lysobacter sp. TaxID=271060 RepID=A0A6J4LIB0_9GAMM|nr:MAG: hypothetical protein AVDCRST_MAG71-1714 [uncultured Lysobacter sp.]
MSTKPADIKTPSTAARAFRGSKPSESSRDLTSEAIEAHLAAFRRAGGKVEVLGVTQTLKKIEMPAAPAAPAKPAARKK